MRIYSFTPNPALDLSGHVHEMVPNEKNYVFAERLDPGGNGINAARMASRLGGQVTLLGFLGGVAGSQIIDLLKSEEGARNRVLRFTRIRETTRTNVTVTNDSDHQQTRLTFPGPHVTSQEKRLAFQEVFRLEQKDERSLKELYGKVV